MWEKFENNIGLPLSDLSSSDLNFFK